MAESTVPTEYQAKPVSNREDLRGDERYLAPPVDIHETKEELIAIADLPGVDKENINVRVENDELTIEGKVRHAAPGDAIYNEFSLLNFYRRFTLSEKIDREKISANLKNGVLTLKLPKAEEAKPRKIAVSIS